MTRRQPSATRAVIFDLDGVLVDTMDFHFRSWKEIATKLGVDLPPTELEGFRGIRREHCLNRILGHCRPVDTKTYQRLLDEKNELYLAALAKSSEDFVLPGVRALMAALRARKIPCGLASASKNAAFILNHSRLMGAFDAISDGHFSGPPKPSPSQITHVAGILGVEPQATAVFEDAAAGIVAAKAAGALSIGIGSSVRFHAACDRWYVDLSSAASGAPLSDLLSDRRG